MKEIAGYQHKFLSTIASSWSTNSHPNMITGSTSSSSWTMMLGSRGGSSGCRRPRREKEGIFENNKDGWIRIRIRIWISVLIRLGGRERDWERELLGWIERDAHEEGKCFTEFFFIKRLCVLHNAFFSNALIVNTEEVAQGTKSFV